MRLRLLTTVFAVALSFCLAGSASAFGFWGSGGEKEDDGIRLDEKWSFDFGSSWDFDWDIDWEKKERDYSWDYDWEWEWDFEWPSDGCLICPKPDDGPRSAIPEPTAALLFAGGAVVLGSRRRRNR